MLAPAVTMNAQSPAERVSAEERASFHQYPQWAIIAPHLPDPKTGSVADLEQAADVLRARRFPEDALDYYGYALARGGQVSPLLNKMGVVRLELHQTDIARELFLRTVRAQKNDATGWNNLGVTEYISRHLGQAISDYRRASKLDKHSAVYHSNLGMAYFENGDMESARKEFAVALKLDPHEFEHRDVGGTTAHIIGTQNYGKLAFEMARVYAKGHNDTATLLWLAKATEAGYDTKGEMGEDAALRPYMYDARFVMMLKNAQQMKMRSVASTGPAESLGPSQNPEQRRVD